MAVPNFLSSAFRATSYPSLADINDVIAAINTEIATNGSWTDTGGTGVGPWQSPINPVNGSYVIFTATRSAQNIMYFWVIDNQGQIMEGGATSGNAYRINIETAPTLTDVVIYSGPEYLCVVAERATQELFIFGRLDPWPESVDSVVPRFFKSPGPRTNLGALTTFGIINWRLKVVAATDYALISTAAVTRIVTGATTGFLSPTGAQVFAPMDLSDPSTGTHLGRIPQMVLLASTTVGNEYTLLIDAGVTAVFKVLNFAANSSRMLAIRKA